MSKVIDDIIASQEEEEKNKKKKKKKKEKKPKKEREKKVTKEKYEDYDPELIKCEKRKELESEIRLQVDELMRQELKNLKLAVNREKEHPVKERSKKGRQKKENRKGRKGNRDKDLTADRTIESLYKELVEEGLLIQARKTKLSEYIGEYSYLGTALRRLSIEPMPSLLDVRQLVTLYGILPLGKVPAVLGASPMSRDAAAGTTGAPAGSAAVHEKAPLVKSLLLAGPPGVGKKMLVHAICTETGANLFNLSAANIAGKYPGKNGLQMMLHVVIKNWTWPPGPCDLITQLPWRKARKAQDSCSAGRDSNGLDPPAATMTEEDTGQRE
ncbi:IQ and AAA domain-containing protein 1 [Tupaia chinensis]|uniref:IQ and AAA domain-containing protein 1 n=1 Tax=Tupaia chinensis TaxID=246437 RepID=L9LF87_TUPCH|nr:IQ and AAA domain-containing protein 1 [Tupaia chinensis]